MKAATGSPISWQSVEAPSFSVTNYNPVMALAQNHIHFLDVPGASPGDAFIFVIHCTENTGFLLIQGVSYIHWPV